MMDSMLDNGVTEQGAVKRAYDKDGKRLHVCTPVDVASFSPLRATNNLPARSGNSNPVDSNSTRVEVGM